MTDLKLLALDEEDLRILSAHAQDAVVRVSDMGYVRADKRFALLLNRFAWEATAKGGTAHRKRAVLRFERVLSARVSGIDQTARDGVLELLAIAFEPGEAPSGRVLLTFAGGGAVQLEVECIEAWLHDLGAAWAAAGTPAHALEE